MRIIQIRWLILSLLLCMAVYADFTFKNLGDQVRAFKQPGNHADFKDARLDGKGIALNAQVYSKQSANGVNDDVLADPSVRKRFWAGMHRGSKQQWFQQQKQKQDLPGEDPSIKQRARVWGSNLHVPFSSKKADSPYLPEFAQNKIKPFLDKYRRPVKKHTSAVYGINGDANNMKVKDTADVGLQVDDNGPSYPLSFTGHWRQSSLSSVDLNSYADQDFDPDDDDDAVQNPRPKFGARIIHKLENIRPQRRQKPPQNYHQYTQDLMEVERSLNPNVQQESDLLKMNDVFNDINGNTDASQLTHTNTNTGNAEQHNDQLKSEKARVWGTDIRLPWKKKVSGSYFAGPGRVQKYLDSRFQKGYDIIKSNSRQIPNEHDDSSSTPLLRRV
ncbi:hypothetical protein MIR68_012292 [Amoeboaphelidium protococcarum]|nr:hypothetical protein MIR68_012292 [Amoeboaphelidium protococcarum]